VALWLDIVDKLSDLPSGLPQAIARIDMTQWPAPLIQLYLGGLTPAAARAAAEHPDPDTKKGRACEADFYSGELALLQGAKDEAARLFRLAASNCPKTFTESVAAKVELEPFGATP
jgi:lipoprotein NlpI